jgi:hypothetical protein
LVVRERIARGSHEMTAAINEKGPAHG